MAGNEALIEGLSASLARELELFGKATYGLSHGASFWLSQMIAKQAGAYFGLGDARSGDPYRIGERAFKIAGALAGEIAGI